MSKTFALIIGVQDYSQLDRSLRQPQGTSDLRGAGNDVSSMAMLVRMMDVPARNIRVLTNPLSRPNDFDSVAEGRDPVQSMNMTDASYGYATKQGILDGFRWLADNLQADGSQGIIYFSGHSIVTRGGHPALCPADVHRAPPTATVPMAEHWPYIYQATLLSAVNEVVGTSDASVIMAFLDRFLADRSQLDTPRRWAKQCAEQIGVQPTNEGLSRFMKYLGADGPGIGSAPGTERRDNAARILHQCADHTYTEAIIESVLHGDPFTDDDPLRNLISFNKAWVQCMRDVPEESQVHILLETCLKEEPGRMILDDYKRYGVPFAHGNIVLFASCDLGQASNLAVFDNRWHGAFTWSMVSLLSQTAVNIGPDGRSFAINYAALTGKIQSLLGLMDFTQTPRLWAQHEAQRYEVLGRAPGTVDARLDPVRIEEEINAGAGGHIFQIKSGGVAKGWFLRTHNDEITAGPYTFDADSEYWIWTAGNLLQAGTPFEFRRPDLVPSQGNDLDSWVQAQNLPTGLSPIKFDSLEFGGSGLSPVPQGLYVVTRKTGPMNQAVAAVEPDGTKIKWRLIKDAPVSGDRIELLAATKVTLEQADKVIWAKPPTINLQYKGNILIDQ